METLGFAVVGIDPGVQGAVGALLEEEDGKIRPWVWDLPYVQSHSGKGKEFDVQSFIAIMRYLRGACAGPLKVGIEQQQARPGNALSSSMHIVGTAKLIEGICHVIASDVYMLRPQVWKGHFGLNLGKQYSRKQKKERALVMARERFPSLELTRVKDEGRAEALLMAQYMYECRY